jgi:serine phosphatase RsbU (regulator of sigma subunit)/anti-sigma regulatory factor (Ser/Thr protein kinase)
MAAPALELAQPVTLRLAFAPDLASVRTVATAVRNFLAGQDVAEQELFACELCITEASNNAVEYAFGAARELKLVAEALFTSAQIELRVTDHTSGFVLPERIAAPSPQKERGRGLFLIQSLMDEVRYLRGATENILIMRKKRSPAPLLAAGQERGAVSSLSLEDCRRQLAEAKGSLAQMTGELLFRSETLASVFRCCAELGRSDEVADGFGGRLLIDLLHLTSADWYVLRLLSPDGRQLVTVAASHVTLVFTPLLFPGSDGAPAPIEVAVAESQAPARFAMRECANADEPLRVVGAEATGLVCPLCFGGTLVGTIAVGRRAGDFPLGRVQDEVVRTFAEFLAIQTLNLGRQKEVLRNRVVSRELEIAQEIQHLLLPRTLPQLAGFGLAGGWQSAREVGGDFYDAIALDGNSLLLLIADVMGKGVPAALFATTMRGLLRGLAQHTSDPGEFLGGLNRLLFPELSSVNMFITAQVVHIDLPSRRVTAASAGHCPLLFVPPGRSGFSALPTEGLPIGVLPDTVYRPQTALLRTPAALLLHTDGLTDMRNPAGRPFGQRRLKAWMGANLVPERPATEVRDRLTTELNRYRGGAAMTDDQAFLLLTEEGARAPAAPPRRRDRVQLQRGSFLFSPAHS